MRGISSLTYPRSAIAFILSATLPASADSASVVQNLKAQIAPTAKLSVAASMGMTPQSVPFSFFTGTVPVWFRVRTSPQGSLAITLQVTSDFAPAGGPSVAAGSLTYTCSGGAPFTACTGVQTATRVSQTPVLVIGSGACTGGGSPCSTDDPNLVQVVFTVADDPGYQTGTYSAQVMFSISAL